MADYIGKNWQLFAQFVIGKDNGLFTMQTQSVKMALMAPAYLPDVLNDVNISTIAVGDWAIDASASHYDGTATMFEPNGDYLERSSILTSGEALFTGAAGGTDTQKCIVYDAASGRLIAYVALDQFDNTINIPQSDILHVLVNSTNPFYRQKLQDCASSGGGGE